MLYIAGIAVMVWCYLRQKSPIPWPVSAGAPQPAFSQYSARFHAQMQLEQWLYPKANRITLPILLAGAGAMQAGQDMMANYLFSIACLGYVGANLFPRLYHFHFR